MATLTKTLTLREMSNALPHGQFRVFAERCGYSRQYLTNLANPDSPKWANPDSAQHIAEVARQMGYELDPLTLINPKQRDAIKKLCKGAA